MPILTALAGGTRDLLSAVIVNDEPDHKDGSGLGEWSSLIGIITAIAGNVLIALALNVQRYSHIQLHRKRLEASKRARNNHRNGGVASEDARVEEDDGDTVTDTHPLTQSFRSDGSNWTETSGDLPKKSASSYLKSPSWWLGQVLVTVGEIGNFLAYGFAPASIVSTLGVVALISNCIIAPIFFGEVFRKRDFWGVVIAVAGAVTVVLSAKGEETKLDPHDVWNAITTTAFEIYMGVTIFLIIVLMWASPRYGNRTILIDLGLVGLFGGYTVLTTKGVSSMFSSSFLKIFATPVSYGLAIILVGTALMQVRYLNKALQRFDSTQVIPIQFVLFTLSVIIGSAVLYRDFERTTLEQAIKFVGGCLLTFFGVFLISSGRPHHNDDDRLSDDENIEETIGLRDQEGFGPYNSYGTEGARGASIQTISTSTSRRSSRTSRASFSRGGRSFRSQAPIVAPSNGTADQPDSKSALATPTDTSPFLLSNPWRSSIENQPAVHPGLSQTISVDSVPTIHSVFSVAASEPVQSSLSLRPPIPPSSPERLVTPRPSTLASRSHSHHHFSNAYISTLPLSSTVSVAVADTLLRREDSPIKRKLAKRLRPNIRSSLFFSPDDQDDAGVSEPLLVRDDEGAHIPYEYEPPSSGQELSRGRARSLSNTIGQFFGRAKRRRGESNPESGGSQIDSSSGHEQQEGD
ncbi:magnesium transporter NIPA-domain-containing protein [Xylaria bambusicola]|uniref:magnesium transporter NIPA-domain-containing protein n=1 Tax=Xylaria bambusicola TaxID=326684 RepID=UPI00200867F5|nr:magnesium transporter NIPA-domain-containing protein [Xylaria bambusicola]KAI0526653.1 magnesium transporter NIPA-domain-containing protein [Xylaria bambusicola]